MKRLQILSMVVFAALAFTACKDSGYKTTPSGLKYKIIPGSGKDSVKEGDILKMHFTQKLSGAKDTALADTYGKMPLYAKVQTPPPGTPNVYGPDEVFKNLKKGDSLIAVIFIDSLIKKGLAQEAQLPPFMKKGDKITLTFKVLEVFTNDSIANADAQAEQLKDAPRQKKEQEAQMEKMKKDMEAQQKADDAALEKSGEKAKQIAIVENYLKAKGINATKTANGVFVKIDNPGTGAQVADNKYVTIKLDGKKIANDSLFQPETTFPIQLGKMGFIRGLEEGMKQFKQGGKGVVYIPGFLAYGKNPPPGSPFKEYEPIYFNVEITKVSDTDTPPAAQELPGGHSANDAHGH